MIIFQPAISCKLNEVLICTIDTTSKSDTRVIEVHVSLDITAKTDLKYGIYWISYTI